MLSNPPTICAGSLLSRTEKLRELLRIENEISENVKNYVKKNMFVRAFLLSFFFVVVFFCKEWQ